MGVQFTLPGPIGGLAQLGERRTCNAEVSGADPLFSTNFLVAQLDEHAATNRKVVSPNLTEEVSLQLDWTSGRLRTSRLLVQIQSGTPNASQALIVKHSPLKREIPERYRREVPNALAV